MAKKIDDDEIKDLFKVIEKALKGSDVTLSDIKGKIKDITDTSKDLISYLNGMNSEYQNMKYDTDRILKNYQNWGLFTNKLVSMEKNRMKGIIELNRRAREGSNLAKAQLKIYSEIDKMNEKINQGFKNMIGSVKRLVSGGLREGFNYIVDTDKAIKNLNLNIGLSGDRASDFVDTIANAGRGAAKLGASAEDLVKIQNAYNDELGSSAILTSNQLTSMVAISKATNMSLDNVGKLGAEYSRLGGSGEDFKNYIEDTVNSTKNLGLNTTKVLKNIESGIGKLNAYNFRKGREGLKEMAQYAAKVNVEMSDFFNSADKARSLEGAVEMAAQLNVIGGQFAKSDPFRLLNLARNDAAGFAKEIGQMTKDMVVFNKQTGQLDMSALDKDRLKLAAEAMNMPFEKLFNIALENTKDSMAEVQLGGRFSGDDLEAIKKLSQINEKGEMSIKIGDQQKLLSQLSSADVKRIKSDNQRLEDLAKQNMAFDDTMKSAILELKSLLLPMIKTFNEGLKWFNNFFGDTTAGIIAKVGVIGVGLSGVAAALTIIPSLLMKAAANSLLPKSSSAITPESLKTLLSGSAGAEKVRGVTPTPSRGGMPSPSSGGISPAGSASRNIGNITKNTDALGGAMKSTGKFADSLTAKLLAFGGAILMIGGGVYLAATGIGNMADAFAKLNDKQLMLLKEALIGLGVGLGIFTVALVGLSFVAGAAAAPMLAFGGAVALIGAGIGVAAAGIGLAAMGVGQMAESFSGLLGKNAGGELLAIAGGLIAVGTAGAFSAKGLIFGALGMLATIKAMEGINDINFQPMADAFENASRFVEADSSNLDKLKDLMTSMENINLSSMETVLGKLSELMDKGIPVRFENDRVNLVVENIIKLDGSTIAKEVSKANVRIKVGK